jgi:hypothetical protein
MERKRLRDVAAAIPKTARPTNKVLSRDFRKLLAFAGSKRFQAPTGRLVADRLVLDGLKLLAEVPPSLSTARKTPAKATRPTIRPAVIEVTPKP